VLISEWATQIAMAFEAARLISGKGLDGMRQEAAMRIMAIHAGHGALRQAVAIWPLELRPGGGVAACALLIDGRGLTSDEPVGTVAMDGMTRRAGYVVLGMAALQPADLRGLIEVALQADPTGGGGRQIDRVEDVLLVRGLGVFAAGAMAGLARLGFPATARLGVHNPVGTFLQSVIDVFVTGLASLGPDIRGRRVLGYRRTTKKEGRHGSNDRRGLEQWRPWHVSTQDTPHWAYCACTWSTEN